MVAIDTRERYPYRFAAHDVVTERAALPAGDYAVLAEGDPIASVERKTLENLAASLSDGTLAFQVQRLAEIPSAAVVVEGRYTAPFRSSTSPAHGSRTCWFACTLRYPEVPVVFADSRRFAEELTYRFLAAALAEAPERTSVRGPSGQAPREG